MNRIDRNWPSWRVVTGESWRAAIQLWYLEQSWNIWRWYALPVPPSDLVTVVTSHDVSAAEKGVKNCLWFGYVDSNRCPGEQWSKTLVFARLCKGIILPRYNYVYIYIGIIYNKPLYPLTNQDSMECYWWVLITARVIHHKIESRPGQHHASSENHIDAGRGANILLESWKVSSC